MDDFWLPVILLVLIGLSGMTINWFKNPSRKQVFTYADQKSLILFRILYPAAILLAFLVSIFVPANLHLSKPAYYGISIFLFLLGMMIRWTAILSLKKAFTVKIAIVRDHQLKTDGIYRYMRHPSYTGLIIYYTGLGISLDNLISILILIGITTGVIWMRIKLEEKVLIEHFGSEYLVYQKNTKALFPGII